MSAADVPAHAICSSDLSSDCQLQSPHVQSQISARGLSHKNEKTLFPIQRSAEPTPWLLWVFAVSRQHNRCDQIGKDSTPVHEFIHPSQSIRLGPGGRLKLPEMLREASGEQGAVDRLTVAWISRRIL